ncbi:flavodoxin family protein [Chloroflexota bacterium]
MKVLGIVCSPRKEGNTEIMMTEALAGARKSGAEVEIWAVSGKSMQPCDDCGLCNDSGHCHINDDLQNLYDKIREAEGLIFGSPVYFMSITAQAKIILDRLHCMYIKSSLVDKVAGAIMVGTSYGHYGTCSQFSNFFCLNHMFMADFAWGFARHKGEVKKDDFALKSSYELGREVVALINQKLKWPNEFKRTIYAICRDDYGIDNYPLRHLSRNP